MLRVLNVAEKNDAAKGIAEILSRGNYQRRDGRSVYNKLYEFNFQLFGRESQMVITSVSGHLFNYDFVGQYKSWNEVSPLGLFEAPIEKTCSANNGHQLVQQLEFEASKSQHLIIWTDCDREGENIGFEIIDVCVKKNSRLILHRARFSEITMRSITNAIQNLTAPDKRISDAVDCRQELDLRIGAAFTRFQTMRLQKKFPEKLRDLIISYGSCQFPTLGFIVERYKARLNFIEEPFWKLLVAHTKVPDGGEPPIKTEFNWRRIRLFDKDICDVYLQRCKEKLMSTVENVTTKPKTHRRPTALDTVDLEKIASRRLRLTAKKTMQIAERLYTKGFISYPRTETNQFPKDMNLQVLVQQQTADHQWGAFAVDLLNRGLDPRNGTKTDQAHPPIHPTRFATPMELNGDDRRVYEFIVRRFLACLSRDARGMETVVDIDVNGECFYASGLIITDRGYLEIYHPYEQWGEKTMPPYEIGDSFKPDSVTMVEGSTSPPSLLTEADLIALMEKHGIGTDATHAEHIEKIKSRIYVALNQENRFMPGFLGLGLVDGYDSMGYPMSKPHLRAELEVGLKEICDGKKTREEVLRVQINKYKEIFERTMQEAEHLDRAIGEYFSHQPPGPDPPAPRPPGNHPRPPGSPPSPPPPHKPTRPTPFNGEQYQNFNDTDSRSQQPPPPEPDVVNDVDRNQIGDIFCTCNKRCVSLTCKKEGPNRGRIFYRCATSSCRFFLWHGTAAPDTAGPGMPAASQGGSASVVSSHTGANLTVCNCGDECKSFTVRKPGPNQGRQFYTCSRKDSTGTGGCGFFAWADNSSENRSDNDNNAAGVSSNFQAGRRQPNKRKQHGKNQRSNTAGAFKDMFPGPIVSDAGGTGDNSGGGWKRTKKQSGFKRKMKNAKSANTNMMMPAGIGKRKCSYCHCIGHTIKTCPQVLRD